MITYLTPGVYFETRDTTQPGITAIRTDIAAFVGLAQRGPLNRPWPVDSWRQFQTVFGDFMAGGYLAYSVKAFFENGGSRCYIVRVAGSQAHKAWGELIGLDGLPTLLVRASSAGRWGNRLTLGLSHGRQEAAQTTGAQPSDGSASVVHSVTGFPAGTLVRLFQRNVSGDREAYHVVSATDFVTRRLTWETPLKLAPDFPGDPVFDLNAPIDLESVTFTLTVFENGALRAIYADLSLAPTSERYVVAVVNANQEPAPPGERPPPPLIEVEDLHAGLAAPLWADWLPAVNAESADFHRGLLTLKCGVDGLASLVALDFTGDLGALERTGLRTLELEPEVALVAIPDIMIRPIPPTRFDPLPEPEVNPCIDPPPPPKPMPLPPGPCPDLVEQPPLFSEADIRHVQQELISHCERLADRFAILDPPPSNPAVLFDPSEILGWRQHFDSTFAALYYPWVLVHDPLRLGGQVVRAAPPSGHAAGVMARVDRTRGVHKAPANEPLQWAQGFTTEISAELQGVLNSAHVNALRSLPGRNLRIYGARTVSSDASLRYINVRRLLLMIEKALRISLQWTVFEPHSLLLRQSLVLAIGGFLAALRQQGALVGHTPEEAYFVRCDQENNPPASVEAGLLIVEVGVALVRPAEFIVVRIGRTRDELEIIELNTVVT